MTVIVIATHKNVVRCERALYSVWGAVRRVACLRQGQGMARCWLCNAMHERGGIEMQKARVAPTHTTKSTPLKKHQCPVHSSHKNPLAYTYSTRSRPRARARTRLVSTCTRSGRGRGLGPGLGGALAQRARSRRRTPKGLSGDQRGGERGKAKGHGSVATIRSACTTPRIPERPPRTNPCVRPCGGLSLRHWCSPPLSPLPLPLAVAALTGSLHVLFLVCSCSH